MCNLIYYTFTPYTSIPYKVCPPKVSPRYTHNISNWVSQGFGNQYYYHVDKLIYNVIELEHIYQKQLYSGQKNGEAHWHTKILHWSSINIFKKDCIKIGAKVIFHFKAAVVCSFLL